MKTGSQVPIYNDGLDSSATRITAGTMQASVLCLDGSHLNQYFDFDGNSWGDTLYTVTIPRDGTRGFVITSALGIPGPGLYQVNSWGSSGDAETAGVPQTYFVVLEGATEGFAHGPNEVQMDAGTLYVHWEARTLTGRAITGGDAVCVVQRMVDGKYWDPGGWTSSFTYLPLAYGPNLDANLPVGHFVADLVGFSSLEWYPLSVRAWGTAGDALNGVPTTYWIGYVPLGSTTSTFADTAADTMSNLLTATAASSAGIGLLTSGVSVTGGTISTISQPIIVGSGTISTISQPVIVGSGTISTISQPIIVGSGTVSTISQPVIVGSGTVSDATGNLADTLSEMHTALGIFTGGVGLYGVTATLADSAGTKIANATFQLNSTGGDVVGWDLSDANGLAITHVNAGSYTLSIAKPGQYTFGSSGQSIAISGNTAVSYVGVAFDPGAPTDPSRCNVYAWISKAGAAVSGVVVEAELVADYGTSGDWLEVPIKVSATTSTAGYAVLTLLRSQTYRYTVQGTNIREEIAVPNAASVNVITKF